MIYEVYITLVCSAYLYKSLEIMNKREWNPWLIVSVKTEVLTWLLFTVFLILWDLNVRNSTLPELEQ